MIYITMHALFNSKRPLISRENLATIAGTATESLI